MGGRSSFFDVAQTKAKVFLFLHGQRHMHTHGNMHCTDPRQSGRRVVLCADKGVSCTVDGGGSHIPTLVAPERTIWRLADKDVLNTWVDEWKIGLKLMETLSQLLGFNTRKGGAHALSCWLNFTNGDLGVGRKFYESHSEICHDGNLS